MAKVFPTLIGNKRGNCIQAVVASMLNLSLDDVPNFQITLMVSGLRCEMIF